MHIFLSFVSSTTKLSSLSYLCPSSHVLYYTYVVGENAPISRVSVFLLPLCPPKFGLSPILQHNKRMGEAWLDFPSQDFPPMKTTTDLSPVYVCCFCRPIVHCRMCFPQDHTSRQKFVI